MTISVQKQPKTCNNGARDPVAVHIIRMIKAFSQFIDYCIQFSDFTLVKAHSYT